MRWVFGYGSLIYEPQRPGCVVEVVSARLRGWSRRLNKVSWARGCEIRENSSASVPGFVDGTRKLSLAFGTVPGGAIDGALVAYRDADWDAVLAELRVREGCRPDLPRAAHHYEETEVDVAGIRATTFVSIPKGAHHRTLDDAAVARVLDAATPEGPYAGKRRGWHYVEALGESHIATDPWLRALMLRRGASSPI